MDCCAHEDPDGGDARFDIQQVADGVHVAVAAPAYKVNCNTAIIETDDGLIVVDTHSKPSAARVIVDHLRDLSAQPVRYVVHEKPFSAYGDYRPWRMGLLGNIERTYAMVS